MRLLLIHQNFPGQFRQLVPFLLSKGHEIVAICSHTRELPHLPGLNILRYEEPNLHCTGHSHGSNLWHEALVRADSVGRLLLKLKSENWCPDRILVHCGWGEAIPVKLIWPHTPMIVWPELWLRTEHVVNSLGYVPSKLNEQSLLHLARNSLTEASLAQASAWVLPTLHQAKSFPEYYQTKKMHIIHEGIDTNLAFPNDSATYEVRGIKINKAIPTITFVNRNLEKLRGFDTFMRSLPLIQDKFPDVRILIVGDNEGGYGEQHPSGRPLKEVMIDELGDKLNLDRLHFLGRIPHSYLITILQASWVHVYLSYPFIMGWSLLEAMACGCCIVGSRGMPVQEVIQDGVNGLLVDVDDHITLAQRISILMKNRQLRQQLSHHARLTAVDWDQKIMLPKLLDLVENLEC